MNRLQESHVSFDMDRTEIIPGHNWPDIPEKRTCEWKTLDLQIDDQVLRSEIQRASQAVSDPWTDMGKDPGISIWRVTKYRATKWPEEEYGHFYDADAFIVLNEEYEVVVVKCLELDWKLGYEGIIHREVQSRESDLFKSYFRPMTIWKGDAESRLRSLKGETYPARLLRYYKPLPRRPFTCMKEVPTQRQYLDSDLIFVMDIGQTVYQWNGAECNPEEKSEVISYCQKLRADRGMKCQFEMVEETESHDHYFNFYLKEGIESGVGLDSDDETNVQVSRYSTLGHIHKPRLFQVAAQNGITNFKVLKEGTLTAQDLINQKVCIVDMTYECFVWISAHSSPEKRVALQYAHEYLKNTAYPLIPVTVVREGQPSPEFDRALGYTSLNGYHTS